MYLLPMLHASTLPAQAESPSPGQGTTRDVAPLRSTCPKSRGLGVAHDAAAYTAPAHLPVEPLVGGLLSQICRQTKGMKGATLARAASNARPRRAALPASASSTRSDRGCTEAASGGS